MPAGTVLRTRGGWLDVGERPLTWVEQFELRHQREARLVATAEQRKEKMLAAALESVRALAAAYRDAAERAVYRERMELRMREREAARAQAVEGARELRRQLAGAAPAGSHHDRHPGAWMLQGRGDLAAEHDDAAYADLCAAGLM